MGSPGADEHWKQDKIRNSPWTESRPRPFFLLSVTGASFKRSSKTNKTEMRSQERASGLTHEPGDVESGVGEDRRVGLVQAVVGLLLASDGFPGGAGGQNRGGAQVSQLARNLE